MKRLIKSKSIQLIGGLALVIGLLFSLSVPALAESRGKSNTHTLDDIQIHFIKGKVNTIASDNLSFVVAENATSTVNIKVDSNTKYYMVKASQYSKEIKQQLQRGLGKKTGRNEADDELSSATNNPELEQGLLSNLQGPRGTFDRIKSWLGKWRGFGEKASFKDIEVGDGVIVRVMPNETLAKQVLIVKPSNVKRISGKIASIAGNTFTVHPDSGADVILAIDNNAIVELKGSMGLGLDQWVSVVYKAPATGTNLVITAKASLQKPTP
jgi:hypothetical protein